MAVKHTVPHVIHLDWGICSESSLTRLEVLEIPHLFLRVMSESGMIFVTSKDTVTQLYCINIISMAQLTGIFFGVFYTINGGTSESATEIRGAPGITRDVGFTAYSYKVQILILY